MVTRALRPRGKSVDYKSAGMGAADQPGWLKVGQSQSGLEPTALDRPARRLRETDGAENANPQLAAKRTDKMPSKTASTSRPSVKTKPKSASAPAKTKPGSIETKRKLRMATSAPHSAEAPGRASGGRSSARLTTGQEMRPVVATQLSGAKRRIAPKSRGEQVAKDSSMPSGSKKQKKAAAKTSKQAPAEEVIEILDDAEEHEADVVTAAAETLATLQRPAETDQGAKQLETGPRKSKPARGRSLDLQNLEKRSAASRAKQPVIGEAIEDMNAPSSQAPPGKEMQVPGPVPGLSGVSQVPRVSSGNGTEKPKALNQTPLEAATAAMAAAVSVPLPQTELPPPPPPAAHPTMAAYVRLQETHLALQDKYRLLKDGKLTELEKSLKVSCSSIDEHLKMASELAAHWKIEAEHQAKLAQSVAAKDFHDELQRLKMQNASLRRSRMEAEEQIQAMTIKSLELQHQLQVAQASASEKREQEKRHAQSFADAEVQTERLGNETVFDGSSKGSMDGPKEAMKSMQAGPSATDVCHSRTDASALQSPSLRPPSPLCTPAAADGIASACGEDEEEIIVLEIHINEPGVSSRAQATSTPCSVVKRMVRSSSMRPSSSGGPVRVIVVGPDGRDIRGSSANDATPGPTFPQLAEVNPSDDSLFVVSSRKRKAADCEDAPEPKCRLQLDAVEETAATDTGIAEPSPATAPGIPDRVQADGQQESEPEDANKGDVEWIPVQLLAQFTREDGTAPGFVSYFHSVSGFKFEVGPDDDLCSDSEADDVPHLKFRPIDIGNADLPEHFKEDLSFADSQKSNFFYQILDILSK